MEIIAATCMVNNGGCQKRCKDAANGPICSCPSGYELHQDQRSCLGKITLTLYCLVLLCYSLMISSGLGQWVFPLCTCTLRTNGNFSNISLCEDYSEYKCFMSSKLAALSRIQFTFGLSTLTKMF